MADARPKEPIRLDGRTLEGGGQLVRNALVLAALTSQTVTITNIRGSRSDGGGLKAQHLACVRWLQHATNAHVEGAERGSRTLLFEPGRLDHGVSPVFRKVARPDGVGQMYEVRVDVETAGSTGLVLQAVLPYILFSKLPSDLPVHLVLSGGTNVSGSPSYEYISQVLLPMLHVIGLPRMTSTILKRGWSQGGSSIGRFSIMISGPKLSSLPAFRLTRPGVEHARREPAQLAATFLAPAHCHEHFRTIMPPLLHRYFSIPADAIKLTCEDSQHDRRLYLILVAKLTASCPDANAITLACDKLYSRKLPTAGGHMRATTEMAEEVAAKLEAEIRSGACADEHMRDQLVIFQALSQGPSEVFPGYLQSEEEGEGEEEEEQESRKTRAPGRQDVKLKRHRQRQRPSNSAPPTDTVDAIEQYEDPFDRELSPTSSAAGTISFLPSKGHVKFPSTSMPVSNPSPSTSTLTASTLAASTGNLSLSDHTSLSTTTPISTHTPTTTIPSIQQQQQQQQQQLQSPKLRPASLHTLTAEWVCALFLPREEE